MTPQPTLAAVGIGSNLGDRLAQVRSAVAAMSHLPLTRVLRASGVISTAPVRVGQADPGGDYLNAAALLETTLEPHDLLAALRDIESAAGRDRALMGHGAARVLDLDLLLFGDRVITTETLTVPHPAMHQREFVLEPLAQIAPEMPVPTMNATVGGLLARLRAGRVAPGAAGLALETEDQP